MPRRPELLWVSVLLLVAAGCPNRAFLSPPESSMGYKKLVDGRPGQVSAILEAGLNSSGCPVIVKRERGDVRLAGQSSSGQVFCIYVRPEQTVAGQRTAVILKCDRQPDPQLWETVVDCLAVSAERRNDEG
jgi:hypothetical protein